MLPILAIMVFGVSGCAGNNHAGVNERYQNNAQPIGYYSNENHPNQTNALFTDDDGPLTEMMDHSLGAERGSSQNQTRMQVQTKSNSSNTFRTTVSNSPFNTNNTNYSGSLNQRNTDFSTDSNTLGKISDQISSKAAKVENVQDVRTVVYSSSILISIQLKDKSQAEKTIQAVHDAVHPYVDGRPVKVITNK
jgi:spore cortex protein